MSNKEKILKLKSEGKTCTEIKKLLNMSSGIVYYHYYSEYRERQLFNMKKKRKQAHPYEEKIHTFSKDKYKRKRNIPISTTRTRLRNKINDFFNGDVMARRQFTVDDVITKFGENPICYLTGEQIDITKPGTYQFDHIIPKCRGGDNSLENMAICTKQANESKRGLTPDEFIFLCKKVLEHNGYSVSD